MKALVFAWIYAVGLQRFVEVGVAGFCGFTEGGGDRTAVGTGSVVGEKVSAATAVDVTGGVRVFASTPVVITAGVEVSVATVVDVMAGVRVFVATAVDGIGGVRVSVVAAANVNHVQFETCRSKTHIA